MNLITKDIEKAIVQFEHRAPIRSLRTSAIYPNHECDALVITNSNYAVEYEIKISRGDFFADFKKKKHKSMRRNDGGKISRFYYVMPKGMVSLDDIPQYAGLIYVDKSLECSIIKPAPRLRCEKVSDKDINRVYRSIMFRWLKDQSEK